MFDKGLLARLLTGGADPRGGDMSDWGGGDQRGFDPDFDAGGWVNEQRGYNPGLLPQVVDPPSQMQMGDDPPFNFFTPAAFHPPDGGIQRELAGPMGDGFPAFDRNGNSYDQRVVPQSFQDLNRTGRHGTYPSFEPVTPSEVYDYVRQQGSGAEQFPPSMFTPGSGMTPPQSFEPPRDTYNDTRQWGSGMEQFPPDMFSGGHDPYRVMGQFNDPFAGQQTGGAGGFGMFGPSQPSDPFQDRFPSPSFQIGGDPVGDYLATRPVDGDFASPTAQQDDLAAARDAVNSRGNSSAGTSHIWPGLTNAARPPNLQWQSGLGPGGLQQAPGVWGGMSNTTIGPAGLPMINYF